MDALTRCLDLICLVGQGIMHLCFCAPLAGGRRGMGPAAGYLAALFALETAANALALPGVLVAAAELAALYGAVCLDSGGGGRPEVRWAAVILATCLSRLSFGIADSLGALVFPYVAQTPGLYWLMSGATALSLAFCAACYWAAQKALPPGELGRMQGMGLLLCPVLFFFAAQTYIMQTAYAQAVYPGPSAAFLAENAGRHTALLLLQVLGLGALFCTLYACWQLCRGMQAQAGMRSLEQAARAQRVYAAEARARYDQTRAFRHDLKNHLCVLDGLLRQGRLAEGRAYLRV